MLALCSDKNLVPCEFIEFAEYVNNSHSIYKTRILVL